MLIHDDYSGTSFYTETEKYQEPLLSRRQQREAKRLWDEWCFILHLMRWGSFPDHMLDGFGRRMEEKPINFDDWLKQEQQYLEETERHLRQRQQRKE